MLLRATKGLEEQGDGTFLPKDDPGRGERVRTFPAPFFAHRSLYLWGAARWSTVSPGGWGAFPRLFSGNFSESQHNPGSSRLPGVSLGPNTSTWKALPGHHVKLWRRRVDQPSSTARPTDICRSGSTLLIVTGAVWGYRPGLARYRS